MEFFPSIVANARTVDNLVNGLDGRSESLILVTHILFLLPFVYVCRNKQQI